jgi:hypothetical protein
MSITGNKAATLITVGKIITGIKRKKITPNTTPKTILIGRVIRKNPALKTQRMTFNATIPNRMSTIPARISIITPFFSILRKKVGVVSELLINLR